MKGIFDLAKISQQIKELETETLKPNFWDEPKKAGQFVSKLNKLKNKISLIESLKTEITDALDLIDIASSEDEAEILKEINNSLPQIESKLHNLELEELFNGEYDEGNAFFSIHSGAGGTESCDWVEMLARMYVYYFQSQKFSFEEVNKSFGEEVGLKNITYKVCGDYAYGKLLCEKGVHRMVRISPFDANKRRHTTFAAVDVVPVLPEDKKINFKDEELKIDTFRASGAGGQHVNKTSSAVRITHIATGITVSCQSERSQFQNKDNALAILKARIFARLQAEKKEKIEELRGEVKDISWGHQIRSYVFHPYAMVKDHRTNYETGNVQKVLDGNLEDFVYEFLKQKSKTDD